jgi:hypothetical protein
LVCPDGIHIEDFAALAAQWQRTDCSAAYNDCGRADMDASGQVDITDLMRFAEQWMQDF